MVRPKLQKFNIYYFAICVILEAIAICLVVGSFFFDCVKGNEVGPLVTFFLLFAFSALIPDVMYLILMLKLDTLGRDPLAVLFNFVIGSVCILIGLSLVLVLLHLCGNLIQYLLVVAGVLMLGSGVVHILNALMCMKKLPLSERYYYPKHKANLGKDSKKKDKQAKQADKDAKKADKGAKKDDKAAKKEDKKADKGAKKTEIEDKKKGKTDNKSPPAKGKSTSPKK